MKLDYVGGTDHVELSEHEAVLRMHDKDGNEYRVVVDQLKLHHYGKAEAKLLLHDRPPIRSSDAFEKSRIENPGKHD